MNLNDRPKSLIIEILNKYVFFCILWEKRSTDSDRSHFKMFCEDFISQHSANFQSNQWRDVRTKLQCARE